MAGRRRPSTDQLSEPDVIAPGHVDWRSAQVGMRRLPECAPPSLAIGRLWPLAILSLAPGIAVLSVLIIAGLLGFFVAWLATVGFLFAATLVSDLLRAFWHYAHPPVGAVKQQAVG
jgi:hypothetical protein